MGADLILMWFGIEKGKDLGELKKRLNTEIDKITTKHIEEILTYYDYIYGESPEVTSETLENAKKEFREVVEELFKCLNYRDVSFIDHKDQRLYVTGGMSWGDSPTESYDTFQKFCALPKNILQNTDIS